MAICLEYVGICTERPDEVAKTLLGGNYVLIKKIRARSRAGGCTFASDPR